MSEYEVNMPEYVWIYNNRQGSEYVLHNPQHEVTLQVNEYLLGDVFSGPSQTSKMEHFGMIVIV